MTEIKPALNAEEWAELASPHSEGPLPEQEQRWRDRVWELKRCVEDAGRPHALGALALHNQPYGFTWGDVDALAACVEKARQYAGSEQADAVITRATEAIRHMGALLPPRAG